MTRKKLLIAFDNLVFQEDSDEILDFLALISIHVPNFRTF